MYYLGLVLILCSVICLAFFHWRLSTFVSDIANVVVSLLAQRDQKTYRVFRLESIDPTATTVPTASTERVLTYDKKARLKH